MRPDTPLCFAADHPAFAGHFPGRPIVPGVLLLDAVLHQLAQVPEPTHWQITSAKFLSPVQPGESLLIRWQDGSAGSTRFSITAAADGRTVASGACLAGLAA